MAKTGSNTWLARAVYVDPTDLPQTVDLSPSRTRAGMFVAFGAVWCLGMLLAASDVSDPDPIAIAVWWVVTLIGAAMMLSGAAGLMRSKQATLGSDGVQFESRGLLGSKSWWQPYAAFRGVARREMVFKSRNQTSRSSDRSPTYQIIELLHEDAENSVPLYVMETTTDPRALWEEFSRQLKVPALEMDRASSSGVQARHHGELDTSLRDLVEGGKVNPAFDRDSPAPAGLRVDRDGPDSLTITITARRTPYWFLGVFMLPGAGFFAAAFFLDLVPTSLIGFGLIPMIIAAVLLYLDRTSYRRLTLDRDGLALSDRVTVARHSRDAMSFAEIETIAIRREKGNLGDELVISGDQGSVHVGVGLSHEALVWLKGYLTAAIATA